MKKKSEILSGRAEGRSGGVQRRGGPTEGGPAEGRSGGGGRAEGWSGEGGDPGWGLEGSKGGLRRKGGFEGGGGFERASKRLRGWALKGASKGL